MARDAKGRRLTPGDIVLVPCRVRAVVPDQYDGDNLVLETCASYPPQVGIVSRKVAMELNSRMILRNQEGDDLAFEILEIADGEAWIVPKI